MGKIDLSIINLRTNKEIARAAGQTYINLQPHWQREYEVWDDKLKTRFIESLLIGRSTNPIWNILNPDDESEGVLDGMHRLKTALSFLNNGFKLKGKYFHELDKSYDKKDFDALAADDRSKIRKYEFDFNVLPSSYFTDSEKRRDMYEILNRSSKPLNDFEFNKVIYHNFYDIIKPYKKRFIDLFLIKKDSRGETETEIINFLVFSQELPNSWTSTKSLLNKWYKQKIGTQSEDVNTFISLNKTKIQEKLEYTLKDNIIFKK